MKALKIADSTLHVTLATDLVVRRQNRLHRKIDKTTDVLSFPTQEPQRLRKKYSGRFLGDILISLDQAARQARVQKIKFEHEVLFLIIHSILHLIGFDHIEEGETHKMQKLESELWKIVL